VPAVTIEKKEVIKMKRFIKCIIIVFVVMMCGLHMQSDDKELFMGLNIDQNLIKPNVVVLMDSSGSMNTIVYYPKKGLDKIDGTEDDGYNPNEDYSGYVESAPGSLSSPKLVARWRNPDGNAVLYEHDEIGSNWTGCYQSDGSGSYFGVGGNGTSNFNEGERIMYIDWGTDYWGNKYVERIAVATIERKDSVDGTTWFKLKDIEGDEIIANSVSGGTINGHFQRAMGSNYLLVDQVLYGNNTDGGSVRYPDGYVKWMYCHATEQQLDAIRNFNKYGVFVYTENLTEEIINTPTTPSICSTDDNPRVKRLWTRIQVSREVICWLAREHNTSVKLGLFDFATGSDPEGAHQVEELGDMSTSTKLDAFLDKIWAVKAISWTPLAEALSDIWLYYKPGLEDGKTYWPVDYELDHNVFNTSAVETPVAYWCQNNYVVIMTDGESTRDDFDGDKYYGSMFKSYSYPVKRQDSWENWTDGWGDPDNNDPIPTNYNPNTATYCPNETCWTISDEGSDYLDDMAYFLRHQDMFPDDDDNPKYFRTTPNPSNPEEAIWPGQQNIYTYTIGFNINNHLLQQTAINGDGGYYTADSFEELQQAFQDVITSINLRNFAFSSITAPKKTATTTNTDLTISYVGYFMPSQSASIWEGHLLAFELEDKWGFDTDTPEDQVDPEEYVYKTQLECVADSNGRECVRMVSLSLAQEWDAADKIPDTRYLYTHNSDAANPNELIEFSVANSDTLQPLFGTSTTLLQSQQIIEKVRWPQLADIFHSDVGFVGGPSTGKKYLSNLNPTGEDDELYSSFYSNHKCRDRVLFAGTNDGVLHMFYADAPLKDRNGDGDIEDEDDCPGATERPEETSGQEVWGFIPDEVLPTLTQIVVNGEHTYTVDGHMTANDIFYKKEGNNYYSWATILTFGLRRGGRAYYTLDITTVDSQPKLLWKFKDEDHSGQSWGKPVIGKIKIQDPDNSAQLIDQWVAILPGGFEFNSDNPTDPRGKSLFIVNASNGDLIWKVAYIPPTGGPDSLGSNGFLTDSSSDDDKFYTSVSQFNYSIPTAVTAVDKDNNGFLDTIYFGNLGGHIFKADISSSDLGDWTTQLIFEDKHIPEKGPATVTGIAGEELTLNSQPFSVGDSIMGLSSYATGYILTIDDNVMTITTTSGGFQLNESIISYAYDPIYLAPGALYDTCYQLWLTVGTGDRDRPRSNINSGRFFAFRDNGTVNFIEDSGGGIESSTLARFTWTGTNYGTLTAPSPAPTDLNGLYFDFPDSGEKLFDPAPFIIPDENVVPHIYLNTYQPPVTTIFNNEDPCNVPQEGTMKIYDIALKNCGVLEDIEGTRETGRIAGGGIYGSKEFVIYKSGSGDVADVPGGEGGQFGAEVRKLPYSGGLLFWKERNR
jgi:hypothetical protein